MLAATLMAGGGLGFVPPASAALVNFDLYAVTGSATLPGATVPVLGYNTVNALVSQPGGPTLTVDQGDDVTITLHNNLVGENTALLVQGQSMIPDTIGVGVNDTKAYTFTASEPGTYLYEAGLLPNTQHQVAMGLYGALIVRPVAPGQAYDDPETAFDNAAVLVLSEIDPALNNSANPAAFDMRDYAPKYFLINGKAYPDTDPIASAAGNKVLLRYVNAGARHHSMAVLGLRQNFVAMDAGLLPTLTHDVAAETLAPGQTGDAIAVIPAGATTESRFAVYDANLMLHNNGAAGFGGMLTFVAAGTGGATNGPTTSGVTVAPSPTNGSVDVAVSASVQSASSTIQAAEYFIDTSGAGGTGLAMAATDGTFDSATEAVNATISMTTLAGLSAGTHTIYVRGQDANNTWGVVSSAVLKLDNAGPTTSGLTLTPNPSNGSVNVALHATANDSATGGSNITAAEYFIDATGADGSGTTMTVNATSPIASVDATIVAPVTAGVVSMHAMDAMGNWGPFATITLNVVTGGPVTTNVSAAPNPNNGTQGINSSTPAVRVTATMSSTGSTVSAAEVFIDTVGANGSGIIMLPSDGSFNGATETGYADVPLTTIASLSNGSHTIYVHGKDAAGNWGATSTATLVIDKAAPTISSVTLNPATVAVGVASVTLNVTAADVGTGVTGGQYWIDGSATPPATPTAFSGSSVAISTSTLAGGMHTVYVRVQDGAMNWSAVSSVTLYVVQAVDDTLSITANTSATQTSDANAAAGVLANDQPVGLVGRAAALASAPVRTSGTGAGTITLSCPGSLGTAATPIIGGNTVCTNGAYRVTLNGVGGSGNARRSSKLGTFQFTYTETLNGVSSTATVAITVHFP